MVNQLVVFMGSSLTGLRVTPLLLPSLPTLMVPHKNYDQYENLDSDVFSFCLSESFHPNVPSFSGALSFAGYLALLISLCLVPINLFLNVRFVTKVKI